MLLPKNGNLTFRDTDLASLKSNDPGLFKLLSHGASNDAEADIRYKQLMQQRPAVLAALLNITTATKQINLPLGTVFDYFKELIWDDTLAQDRFFVYADDAVIDQVKLAAAQGVFAPEFGASIFHPGAT